MKAIIKNIGAAFLTVLLLFTFLLPPSWSTVARAESAAAFEQTNVVDDLAGSEIDGEPFSLEKYGFNSSRETQFCYSFYENLQ